MNKKNWGTICFSGHKQEKRGVAMYVKENLKPKAIQASHDERILMVEIQIDNTKILLINIYALNENQKDLIFVWCIYII